MFYCAEAVLTTKGLSYSKHKGVIAAFGKEFVKTGKLPGILHYYLSDGFDVRQAGDYGPVGSVGKEKAEALVENAKEFLREIERYLEQEGFPISG
jgi:uncharacterized protein (UPF0332 family)